MRLICSGFLIVVSLLLPIFHAAPITYWVDPTCASSTYNGLSAAAPKQSIVQAYNLIYYSSGKEFEINLIASAALINQNTNFSVSGKSVVVQGVDKDGSAKKATIKLSAAYTLPNFATLGPTSFKNIDFECPGSIYSPNYQYLLGGFSNQGNPMAWTIEGCSFKPAAPQYVANYNLLFFRYVTVTIEDVTIESASVWQHTYSLIHFVDPEKTNTIKNLVVTNHQFVEVPGILYNSGLTSTLEIDGVAFTDLKGNYNWGSTGIHIHLRSATSLVNFVGETSTFTNCNNTVNGSGALDVWLDYTNPDLEAIQFDASKAFEFEGNEGCTLYTRIPLSFMVTAKTTVDYEPLVERMRAIGQFAYTYYTPPYDWWIVGRYLTPYTAIDLVSTYFPDHPPVDPMILIIIIVVVLVVVIILVTIAIIIFCCWYKKPENKEKFAKFMKKLKKKLKKEAKKEAKRAEEEEEEHGKKKETEKKTVRISFG